MPTSPNSPDQDPLPVFAQQLEQTWSDIPSRSFRLPEDDRVSLAQADLGGGPSRETLMVDPPRFARTHRNPRPARPGHGAERGVVGGADEARDMANAAWQDEAPGLSGDGLAARSIAKGIAKAARRVRG